MVQDSSRRSFLPTLISFSPYVLLTALLLRENEDFDTWFHLGVGRWIWQHHQVPTLDPFSWTAALRPYVDSHWFFQMLTYPAYMLGGMPLLVFLQAAVFLAAFWVLGRSLPERRPAGIWEVCLLLAIFSVSDRFLLRPETLTFLFMAIFWQRLFRSAARLSWKDAVGLGLCQVVWLNSHGLFPFGLVMTGSYLAGAAAARWLPLPEGWRSQEDRQTPLGVLVLLGVSVAIACVVSPYGFSGLRYAWLLYAETRHATGHFMQAVAELANPYQVYQLQPAMLAYYAVSAVTLVSVILNRRRLRLSSLALTAAFFSLAQHTIRNTTYFCFLSAPFAAANLIAWASASPAITRWRERWDRRESQWQRPVFAVLLGGILAVVWFIVSDRYYIATAQTTRFGVRRAPYSHVEDALAFADRNGFEGHFLNDILFGGFVLWNWAPAKKLFVDGRLEVYGEDFLTEYKQAMDQPDRFWNAYAQRYQLDYLVLSVLSPYSRQLISYLIKRPDWPLVYADDAAMVFVHRDGLNRERVKKIPTFQLPAPSPEDRQPPSTASRFWLQPFPLHALSMGRLAILTGQTSLAKQWNRAALDVWPGCADALYNLGTLAFEENDLAGAERYNQAALALRPWDPTALATLGGIALQQQRLGEARAYLQKAVMLHPGLAAGWSSLGLVNLVEGKNAKAKSCFEKALALGSDDAILHNNLGVAEYRLGHRADALAQFHLALEREPRNAAAIQSLKLMGGS